MERERFIRVPKDAKAMEDYDYGILKKEQLVEMVLSEEQFHELYDMGIFDSINDKCDIIIDDYEEEILALDKIPTAMEVVCQFMADYSNKELEELKKIFELAIQYKTIVGFDF